MGICGCVLVVSFFLCRVVLSPFLLIHMWRHCENDAKFLFYVNFGVAIFFLVMNYYWFFLLVKLVLSPKSKRSKRRKTDPEPHEE